MQSSAGLIELAILQRAIEQLPADDQVLQCGLQPSNIERACRNVGSRAAFKRHRDFVVIGLGEAKVDAIFPAVIIVVIEIDAHRVTRDGVEIALTAKEFQILELLVARAGRVVTRDLLASTAWVVPEQVDDNLLDAHLGHLRQKLEAGGGRRIIHTVRGVGFVVR